MPLFAARPGLRMAVRRTQQIARRYESTTAQKATETAKDATAKASQGLSRVASAAGPAIAGAAKGVTGALGKIGGRTGRLIGFFERQVPFVIYYSRVGLELSKLVFQGQKMSPPSLATFQSFYQPLISAIRRPTTIVKTAEAAVQQQAPALAAQARGLSRAQIIAGGVIFAECLGFFTVGEMLGRFKLVGYHGDVSAAHH